MMRYSKQLRGNRFRLIVTLAIGLALCWFAVAAAAAPISTPPGRLVAANAEEIQPPPPPDPSMRRSYNFQDIDIRQALSAMAQNQDINLIMSPDVTGKITLLLHQVVLEEAIRGITMAGGFAFRKDGNSYYVYKPKDIRDPQADMGIIRAPVADPSAGPTKLIYNFQDLDIRQALSALAREQDINVIIAPDVTGKVTVYLNHITVEEAIRAIAMAGGFTYKKQEELYYVYKTKEVLDPQAARLQIRVFRLKYAAIDKVQEILSAIPGMRTVRLHEPSKTVIVEDTPENIAKIETLLQGLDVAPRQVLIEAQIMQVSLADDMSLGVDWQKVFGDLTIGTAGFTAGLTAAPALGLGANITTAAGSREQFMAAINALQSKTKVNFLSTPKILALHGKPSRVQIGGKFGYKTNTFTPTGTTEDVKFLDTGTILDIIPYIDDDNNILLEVNPQINSAALSGGVPIQQTTTVKTSMLAKNGQTMFIGGLIEDSKTGTKDEIPFLGRIPGLGFLFGATSDKIKKDELIILITPQIINLDKPNAQGLEKIRQMEETMAKEPRPLTERLLKSSP